MGKETLLKDRLPDTGSLAGTSVPIMLRTSGAHPISRTVPAMIAGAFALFHYTSKRAGLHAPG